MAQHTTTYGPVDALRGWVERRTDALAARLALPRPTRDGFLFAADAAFYAACVGSLVSLQGAARRVIEHLGLTCDTVVVSFEPGLQNPGRIQRDEGHWFIEVAEKYRDDGPALGAILAHECCHILVEERGVPRFETAVDEVHVDLAAMLTGLGALTLNGMLDRREVRGDMVYAERRSFGYLSAHRLREAYVDVALSLAVGPRRALRHLGPGADPWRVARLYAQRAVGRLLSRAPRLAYRPPAAHAVTHCPSAACPKRLRVPVGAVGTARCPACGASRPFDARPCAATDVLAAAPMDAAPLPPPPPFARLRRAFNERRAAFALAALLAAYAVVTVAARVIGWATSAPLGAPCTRDDDCRQSACLHPPSPDAAWLWPLRVAPAAGYCTLLCPRGDECPEGFACVDGRVTSSRSLIDEVYDPRVGPRLGDMHVRVCAKPLDAPPQ